MQPRPVAGGEFIETRRDSPELFEPGKTAFDDISVFLCLQVEGGAASAAAAPSPPVGDLARAFGDDGLDPAVFEADPDCS